MDETGMAYNTKKLYKQAIDLIEKKDLLFIEDVVTLLPCRKSTFYEHFPTGSDEMNTIKERLSEKRISMKVDLRSKWFKSDNPSLQIALMKLIGEPGEYERLSGKAQQTPNQERIKPPMVTFTRRPEPKPTKKK